MAKTVATSATKDTDLNDVRVFVAVVESEGFSKAAKVLGLPTSTVSRRVARLEQALGVRLLQRTTRKLSLTELGYRYFERCSRVLSELADAGREVEEAQETPRGRVRVTAPVDLSPVSVLVARFLDRYEHVRVELDLTNRRVDLVEEGYDVALRAGAMPDSSLVAHKLEDSPMSLVASSGYAERYGLPNTMEELSSHSCVVFGALGPRTTWQLRDARGQRSVSVSGRIAVNHLTAAKSAAMAGLGIGMVPRAFCVKELARGELVHVLPSIRIRAGALWVVAPSRHMTSACRAFVSFVRENYAEVALD